MPWTPFENDDHLLQWVKRLQGVLYLIRKRRRYEDQICAVLREDKQRRKFVEWRFYNRVFYMKPRWLRDRSENLPHPYAERSYYEYENFDWGYDSEDEEGTLTAIGQDGETIWTEDMKSGKILEEGEMVVPGAGVFKVEVSADFAKATGRILPTNDQWLRTFFDPEQHAVDPYEREEYGRDEEQKKQSHPRILRTDDDAPNLPKNAGNLVFEEIPNQLTARRLVLKRKVLAAKLEGKHMQRENKKMKKEIVNIENGK